MCVRVHARKVKADACPARNEPRNSTSGICPMKGGSRSASGRDTAQQGGGLARTSWRLLMVFTVIMLLHNSVIRSWSMGNIEPIESAVARLKTIGLPGPLPLFDKNGELSTVRYARSIVGQMMHILPSGLWSILMPFQLNPVFRKKHPALHRWMGRLTMTTSISIALGLAPIILGNATFVGYLEMPAHACFMLGSSLYFMLSGVVGVVYAKAKSFENHRRWMLRHATMGYTVHLQRLIGYVVWPIMYLMWDDYSALTEEGEEIRKLAFDGCFWLSIAIALPAMEIYLHLGGKARTHNEQQQAKLSGEKLL